MDIRSGAGGEARTSSSSRPRLKRDTASLHGRAKSICARDCPLR